MNAQKNSKYYISNISIIRQKILKIVPRFKKVVILVYSAKMSGFYNCFSGQELLTDRKKEQRKQIIEKSVHFSQRSEFKTFIN